MSGLRLPVCVVSAGYFLQHLCNILFLGSQHTVYEPNLDPLLKELCRSVLLEYLLVYRPVAWTGCTQTEMEHNVHLPHT